MTTPLISRRTFLAAGAAGITLGLARIRPVAASPAEPTSPTLFLSARTTFDGAHGFAGFTPDGAAAFEVALPGRGHSSALRPNSLDVVAFARRPGTFLAVIDRRQGRVRQHIDAATGRHFYGHGVFSPDGRLLYTTENAFDQDGRGVIGVYDATDGYRRIGEIDSGEIGPHDLRLLADGRTLVVANGGILTHPDVGRAKLNLATMTPSLAYIDRKTGRLLEEVRLAPNMHQNSIRHLAVTVDDLGGRGDAVSGLSPRHTAAGLSSSSRRQADISERPRTGATSHAQLLRQCLH